MAFKVPTKELPPLKSTRKKKSAGLVTHHSVSWREGMPKGPITLRMAQDEAPEERLFPEA